ncbi:unnamed protein product [Soboliphyme baturini]|uniref:Tubulin domain-containing protein n=1 Tax=Soboliphyme baturini TaxID=241478 RepID=A0A183IRB2_9BILA|nr:unnamed protein product [Soboliphyme baturini]
MPTKHGQYDAITDDLYDVRIPLYNEIAFQHGIHFEAKTIVFVATDLNSSSSISLSSFHLPLDDSCRC